LGFIEGEGWFSIQKKTKNAKYLTINTSFILTQTIEKKQTKNKNKQKSPCWWLSKHF
jgi:hypothetical protein